MKRKFCIAYRLMFGGSEEEALQVFYKATPEYIRAIVASYEMQARLSYYNDQEDKNDKISAQIIQSVAIVKY